MDINTEKERKDDRERERSKKKWKMKKKIRRERWKWRKAHKKFSCTLKLKPSEPSKKETQTKK